MLPAQWTPNQGLQCLGQRIEQASRPGSPGTRLSSATETSLSGLLRHLKDSRWLLADSPMQFCFVDSCITFLSGGWCRAGQASKPYPTRPSRLLFLFCIHMFASLSSTALHPLHFWVLFILLFLCNKGRYQLAEEWQSETIFKLSFAQPLLFLLIEAYKLILCSALFLEVLPVPSKKLYTAQWE